MSWPAAMNFCFAVCGGEFDVGRDGAEVGHDAEDALGLLGAVGADGVGVGRLDGLGRGAALAGLRIEDVAGGVG